MERIKVAAVICSILEIIGLIAIILLMVGGYNEQRHLNVLIGIGGFAAIIKYFIVPSKLLYFFAAIGGFIAIIVSFLLY
jgi:hypothetical protein